MKTSDGLVSRWQQNNFFRFHKNLRFCSGSEAKDSADVFFFVGPERQRFSIAFGRQAER
jgi:hypothetical protein